MSLITICYLFNQTRTRQQKAVSQIGDNGTSSTSSNQNQQTRSNQQVLQSLLALTISAIYRIIYRPRTNYFCCLQVRDGGPLGGQGSVGQVDMTNVMSQVLHSPALNGLLSGVSEQTGVGSPDALRNMLQEFTQSPQMRNVVNQIAVQVDGQDVGSMFSAMGGQGGGMDFSRMFQQMMPIVSRALGATGSTPHQPFSVAEPQSPPQYSERIPDAYENNDQNLQVCMDSCLQTLPAIFKSCL